MVVESKTECIECYYLPRDKTTLDRFALAILVKFLIQAVVR